MPQGEVVIDPFTGQSMSREALEALLVPVPASPAACRAIVDCRSRSSCRPATPREIVARMLRNLKEIHRSADDWLRLLAVLQRLVILLPEAWEERRDRGLAAAELGAVKSAVADLSTYLEQRAARRRPLGDPRASSRARPRRSVAPALTDTDLTMPSAPRWH